jgi:hypothetical protein
MSKMNDLKPSESPTTPIGPSFSDSDSNKSTIPAGAITSGGRATLFGTGPWLEEELALNLARFIA